MGSFELFMQENFHGLYKALIENDRWKQYLSGVWTTISIALVAAVIGIVIGTVIAIIKVSASNTKSKVLKPLAFICDIYLAVIRGTPVVVQLLILYVSVFVAMTDGTPVAMIGFGINSGAYVAEIIRSGITSVSQGQMEAGRSLGLSYGTTMRRIILPQAVRNILPALFNEFIALLKETSIAGYIAVNDLTKVVDGMRGRLFISEPLYIAAVLYLILVLGLTQVQKLIERRMRKSDRR